MFGSSLRNPNKAIKVNKTTAYEP